MKPPTIMLTATEASGDELGAGLMRALSRRLAGDVRFVGVGGPAMAAEGMTSAFDIADFAILGALEGILAYPKVLARVAQAVDLARKEAPAAAVLIDSWGFSQRLAGRLGALEPRPVLIKYVAPQVWATRPGRAALLARRVDHLLTINSFDGDYFRHVGLASRFVGAPATVQDFSGADPEGLRKIIGVHADDPILLLLPGSRGGEIERLTPVFGAAADRLAASRPRLRIVIAAADGATQKLREMSAGWTSPVNVVEGLAHRLSAMRAATAALACSGTVTTQLAAAGTAMVVAYRLGMATHLAAKVLIRTRYICLINVAAQRFVVPERVQGDCRPDILAADLAPLLDDPSLRRAQACPRSPSLWRFCAAESTIPATRPGRRWSKYWGRRRTGRR